METRASYVLIGTFVLCAVAALIAFVIWLARIEIDAEFAYYDIYFEGSVAGLSIGGDVQYRGIKIGTVSTIAVDPEDPSRVRVRIEVIGTHPIREGDEAVLQLQGITGVSFINIDGATADKPPLEAKKGEEVPVIPSKPSQFERLFEGAPQLVNRAIYLTDRAAELLREENQQLVTQILSDIATLTSLVRSRSDQFLRVLDAFDESSDDVAAAAKGIRELTDRLNGLATHMDDVLDQTDRTLKAAERTMTTADALLADDAKALVADLRTTSRSISQMAEEAEAMLAENREPLNAFAGDGLVEFSRFVTEARLLVASLSRVAERLETDGARFLLGTPKAEFTPNR